jgi:hypothetical protein
MREKHDRLADLDEQLLAQLVQHERNDKSRQRTKGNKEQIQENGIKGDCDGFVGAKEKLEVLQPHPFAIENSLCIIKSLKSNDHIRISHIPENKCINHRREDQQVRRSVLADIHKHAECLSLSFFQFRILL